MKLRGRPEAIKNELNMTSMIDVVFLLLIFFVMTFKIVEQEGDFNIRMPAASQGGAPQDLQLPLKLRLMANNTGQLTSMQLNELNLGTDFEELNRQVIALVAAGAGSTDAGPEIEIDTDYLLRYEHVVKAMTMTSGHIDRNTKKVVPLIEKVKFAPPRKPK
jgi:biopolymer transport protein ExbD